MNIRTTVLFIILATIFCLTTLIEPYPLNWLVKTLPILVLIFITSLQVIVKSTLPKLANNQTSNTNGKTVTMLLIALLFSACGDILLAMHGEQFFIFGLGAFLIAHLFFIVSFMPLCIVNQANGNESNVVGHRIKQLKQKLIYVPLYLLSGSALFSLMAGSLNELFIPVFVYMLVLLVMAVCTLLSTKSNKWLIVGGICFVVSDSLIGITKFYTTVPYSPLWIMITYYTAQYCLVNGLLLATDEKTILKTTAASCE